MENRRSRSHEQMYPPGEGPQLDRKRSRSRSRSRRSSSRDRSRRRRSRSPRRSSERSSNRHKHLSSDDWNKSTQQFLQNIGASAVSGGPSGSYDNSGRGYPYGAYDTQPLVSNISFFKAGVPCVKFVLIKNQ